MPVRDLVLTQDGNVEGLGRVPLSGWTERAHGAPAGQFGESGHGEQEVRRTTDTQHVLSPFVRVQPVRDCEGAELRAGNVHSAHEWRQVLERSFRGTRRRECAGTFAPTPHSPNRTSMSTWRSGESSTQYCEQQSAAMGDRSTADTTCGEAAEASSDPIRWYRC